MMKYVLGVKLVRGMSRNISDHFGVQCKVGLMGIWKNRGREGLGRIKSEKIVEREKS